MQYRRDREKVEPTFQTVGTAASSTSHPGGEGDDRQVPPTPPLPLPPSPPVRPAGGLPPPPPVTSGAAAPGAPPLPTASSSFADAIKAAADRTSSITGSNRCPASTKQQPPAAVKQPGLSDLASIVAQKALERQKKVTTVSDDA